MQTRAGALIGRDLPRGDRVRLALGQQNGLTAIALALALQPYLPSAVGIIAIAILVVNIMHILSNGIWTLTDDYSQRAEGKSPSLANHEEATPVRGLTALRRETATPSVRT
jgi:hypothetical protein